MKLKFKVQPYQTTAVESVIDCFAGQVNSAGVTYRVDPGRGQQIAPGQYVDTLFESLGFRNAPCHLSDAQILANIQAVQRRQNLPISKGLDDFYVKDERKKCLVPVPVTYKKDVKNICSLHLDIEMETGTGKTYCYIKTIFELHKLYGWSKFIIVVPSIAIREGVMKSLAITAEHFAEIYNKKIRYFAYSSKELDKLESFSSDSGISVMVINQQAFNASLDEDKSVEGKKGDAAARVIFKEQDSFQSRVPIDVISANRPILILDEPQKIQGAKTLKGLAKFKPLFVLRYSATHSITHNKIHRLDALDAYNLKLVKKIAVRGIAVKGLAGTNAYLYLESIETSKKAPVARIEMEVRQGGGIKRIVKRLERGRDLFAESNELDQYKGFVIAQIDATTDTVEFTNGQVLTAGDATGDITEMTMRRIQIREAIKAHLDKEQALFTQGVKVLSLFFIDEVAKYRDYSQPDEKGEYARIFEEEYALLKQEYLDNLGGSEDYAKYLENINVTKTHNGYFSIDKNKKLTNPNIPIRNNEDKISDDISAYDLILKDKERLLSLNEATRFIFSHSALREGWDNPNVFVLCMLKHSDNTTTRRQEVGRGLRISVNLHGDRMDNPATVHDVNVLTVIASESYKDFVSNLQQEISESLSERPRKADEAYFTGKIIATENGPVEITPAMAKQIYKYLLKNDYTDDADHVATAYHEAKANGTMAPLPTELAPHAAQIFGLIDSVFSESGLPTFDNERRAKSNPLNSNFEKKEFKALWNRINRRAVYRVEFDSVELVQNSISTLNKELHVTPLQYTIQSGVQGDQLTDDKLKNGDAFTLISSTTEAHAMSVYSAVSYDLIGKIAENTHLTRKTITEILRGVRPDVFDQFKQNPEHFIAEASRLINEQKATIIIERLSYDSLAESYDMDIFTAGQSKQDFSKAGEKLKNHIYDYAITDSKVEREFVKELDTSAEVVVYAKLPRGFLIPTPVGDYNPDWAISFKEGSVKHIYFVAETKGSMSSMELRAIEKTKIECAQKFFAEVNRKINPEHVQYSVVDSYGKLMEIVAGKDG
ncbi:MULTISPECIES: type III restriction-modification system endonuclease [Desulfovibrio]|uniref:Type III restriction enzyme n=1 Tax=Desulfovibrio desulfuricans TaxID=876 RepID=A0AA94HUG7_DESDE|nr:MULTISPECIES: DEAD/DEAH box helicase family protein [Desulfovibrio]ATD82426.1 restriction endonuclease subunit R [Desulfovibrio sp. G11]SFW66237.1 type III restriction enzyme [Desulfovibrio desulfuricans]SPD35214.1 Type III restriction enzyme, res subunit [Desulfovibrio sp. G11]